MKSSIKTLQGINSLHDVRTYTGAVKKSAKPALPTTAVLELYMRRNEKDRITSELQRLKKRKTQLQTRFQDVEKEMTKLLEQATQTAVEIRGEPKKNTQITSSKKKGKVVIGY
ncbi:hypothetical protein COU03_03590 [bacterium (Candidatus Gribaldobacteria) CG10_big_fil_rev_8_21_14_0_10_41_12]|uniref:Uncharacterized protein n=1 Tax=bacterium (Candidatus Gribaldobacteria) CG10_big_fil_rev_8_21_14_0_10_41_12 TaxID=2014277 RepID=A0A2H0UVT6_9BACT|nr:MAG: hypothetical protein COU03_03590 [bacterium (Candidatus Gribaldobacteria) CG10_big_fil_rev_8_21_14_0_10_41_12]